MVKFVIVAAWLLSLLCANLYAKFRTDYLTKPEESTARSRWKYAKVIQWIGGVLFITGWILYFASEVSI